MNISRENRTFHLRVMAAMCAIGLLGGCTTKSQEAPALIGPSGLGLSITKAYMRIMGGSIHYESAQPRGSTFRLVLPKS